MSSFDFPTNAYRPYLNIPEELRHAERLIQDGAYQAAVKVLDRVKDAEPENLEALILLTYTLLRGECLIQADAIADQIASLTHHKFPKDAQDLFKALPKIPEHLTAPHLGLSTPGTEPA